MNNIIAFWNKLTYNDIILLIIILCLIVYYYIFLTKKQYEGMMQNSCAIIGNHKYDSYCQSNQAKTNNNCESKCSTIVPGLGNVCCSSSCCPNRKRESFVTRKLAPATYTMNEVEIHNALTKTQPGKYKADVNLAPLRSYNGF